MLGKSFLRPAKEKMGLRGIQKGVKALPWMQSVPRAVASSLWGQGDAVVVPPDGDRPFAYQINLMIALVPEL